MSNYNDLDKSLAEYGYQAGVLDGGWFKNKRANEIYSILESGRKVPYEMEMDFLKNAEWYIPIIKLFCEVDYCDSLDKLPRRVKIVSELPNDFGYIKPSVFPKCFRLCIGDSPATIVELFEYAMSKWGISLDEDFTVVKRDIFEEILQKTVRFKGFITTADIKRFIEESCS